MSSTSQSPLKILEKHVTFNSTKYQPKPSDFKPDQLRRSGKHGMPRHTFVKYTSRQYDELKAHFAEEPEDLDLQGLPYHCTLLHLAVIRTDVDFVLYLIEAGAQVNIRYTYGYGGTSLTTARYLDDGFEKTMITTNLFAEYVKYYVQVIRILKWIGRDNIFLLLRGVCEESVKDDEIWLGMEGELMVQDIF